MARVISASIFICLLAAVSYAAESSANLEGFEEEDVASVPLRKTFADLKAKASIDNMQATDESSASKANTVLTPPKAYVPAPPSSMKTEAICAALILLYIIAIFIGRSINAKIASACERLLLSKDGMFHRNFSHVEGKDNGLLKESANLYKLYASGRRHAAGLLAEVQLIPRQDAFSIVTQIISPAEDLIKIDVFMNEESMPPIVLAIAAPKTARALQRDSKDIIDYTHRISVSPKDFPSWPLDKFWVLGEHSSIFQDIFSNSRIQQIFSLNGPHAASMKLFRSMHFTSDNSESTHKQLVRFTFKLPSVDQIPLLLPQILDLVPLFIDTVGTYKLTPELKKRATDARSKQADDDEVKKKRLEALQQKKLDKLLEEKAKLARMNPEARQKAEDKLREKQAEKAMKKMSKKL